MDRLARLCCASLAAVLLSACGGSSSNGADGGTGDGGEVRRITGTVVDAITGVALDGVTVDDGAGGVAVSGADGAFALDGVADGADVELELAREGYLAERYAPGDGEARLDPVALVPRDLAGDGGLGGTVAGTDGRPVAGATLRFVRGIWAEGRATPEAAVTTRTDAAGGWRVAGLAYGNYTCIVLIPGLDPIYAIVQVLGGVDRAGLDVAVAAPVAPAPADPLALGPDEIRIEVEETGPYDYFGVLLRPDGTVINAGSPEVLSGEIRFDGRLHSGARRITLSLDRAEGLTYRVLRDRGRPGSQIGRNGTTVTVVGAGGALASFEPDRSRTGQWTVFRVVGGELVGIAEEPGA